MVLSLPSPVVNFKKGDNYPDIGGIAEISDKVYCNLSDASLKLLLHSEDDAVRKIAALKCIKALPKKRIVKLLDDYVSSDKAYYYNVVHWLDFGISTPRDRAIRAADKILNKDWRV